jgi:glycosyltransferase involved in cell wall biosynthesis
VTRVLVVEPYLAGSHQAWLTGLRNHSRHDVVALTLPGRFWKWRMHGAAVTLARQLWALAPRPDVVLASDMLDVATFLGLARDVLAGVPVAVYFHENQLAYPEPAPQSEWGASRRRRAARRDAHYPFVNLTSALASDRVFWNSAYNRDSFLAALPSFLGAFPDYRERDAPARIAARSRVLPVGLDLAGLAAARPPVRRPGPPRVIWNHRWEHDKGPERFFAALDALVVREVDFQVAVLGESFVQEPSVFAAARQRLGRRVCHWGYVADRAAYAEWLWQGDVVVSTAGHEFFGLAVAEAIACGCQPVLPRTLAYPELIPGEWHEHVFYDDDDGLVERLVGALTAPSPPLRDGLRVRMAELAWSIVADRYDAELAELVERVSRLG